MVWFISSLLAGQLANVNVTLAGQSFQITTISSLTTSLQSNICINYYRKINSQQDHYLQVNGELITENSLRLECDKIKSGHSTGEFYNLEFQNYSCLGGLTLYPDLTSVLVMFFALPSLVNKQVGSLHTLRLESLKPVFQPLHKCLVNNLQFWQVGQDIYFVHDPSNFSNNCLQTDYFTYNSLYHNYSFQKFTYTKLTEPLNSLENSSMLCHGFRSF